MANEYWKDAVGFEGFWEVSNLGRIRKLPVVAEYVYNGALRSQRRPGKLLSPDLGHNGYFYVSLKIDGSKTKHLVHRVVARTFCQGYEPGLTVNHINGVKTDNRPENLEWVTRARNTELQWETGLVDIRGEKHPRSKLTDEQTREITHLLALGYTCTELAARFGVSFALISKIKRGVKPVPKAA